MLDRLLPSVTPIAQVKSSILQSIAGNGVPEWLIGARHVASVRMRLYGLLETAQPIVNDLRIHNEIYDIVDRCEKVAGDNVVEFARLVAAEVIRLLAGIRATKFPTASNKMLGSLDLIRTGCAQVVETNGQTLTFAYTV